MKRGWKFGKKEKLRHLFVKMVDESKLYGIICHSALNMTQTVEYAQYATGGRLGLRSCLV